MDQYKERLEKIEVVLKRWLAEPLNIGKTINKDAARFLYEPLTDIVSRGGKRWRPLFMTLVCESMGGADAAIPLSPLVEFPHNASLIHDDIEDESEQRRGKPAIHKLYGIDTAINSGTFLFFLASNCIDSCELNDKNHIYKIWTNCMRKLHIGQATDIFWHRDISIVPSIEEYYTMAALKTGSLAFLAAELGCLAAGASMEKTRELSEAAEKMGIGFQILDDVKNLTTGIPGKKRGDDIIEGKKSLPILLYIQKYPEKKDKVFYCFHVAKNEGSSAPEVEELIDLLDGTGALTEAEEKGRALLNESRDIFGQHDLLNDFFKLIG